MIHDPDVNPDRRVVNTVIVFLLGVIATYFAMGVVPYWELIVLIWKGCVA